MAQLGTQKRGFGCLGYGCIIAVILIFLTIGGIFWLARSAMRNAVQRFTTEKPVVVHSAAPDDAARNSLASKLEDFKRTMNDPHATGEFVLSPSELLAALSSTPFNGKVALDLRGDIAQATFSFPLTALGEWQAAQPIVGDYLNRYVSGTAQARVTVTDGVAAVTFTDLTLNGQVFDGDALKEASEWVSGFANSLGVDPSGHKERSRIGSARIENGTVVVRVRAE